MILTEKDYSNIAALITEGRNSFEYEKDGEMLSVDCTLETDGYTEDDYFRGTGGFVVTARSLSISKAECYDSEGNKTACVVDEARLERLVA